MKLLIMTLTILLAASVYFLQVTETQATSINIHVLVFEGHDGSIVEKAYFAHGADLSEYELPEAPERQGYVFVSWSGELPKEMPDADLYFVAVYMQQELKIRATM
jgi:hypothetical protein